MPADCKIEKHIDAFYDNNMPDECLMCVIEQRDDLLAAAKAVTKCQDEDVLHELMRAVARAEGESDERKD